MSDVIHTGSGTAEDPSGYVVNKALCDAVIEGRWDTLMLNELATAYLRVTDERDRHLSNCEEMARTCRNRIGEVYRLRNLIANLKRGSCWCEMGVDNPMVNTHSHVCKEAAVASERLSP